MNCLKSFQMKTMILCFKPLLKELGEVLFFLLWKQKIWVTNGKNDTLSQIKWVVVRAKEIPSKNKKNLKQIFVDIEHWFQNVYTFLKVSAVFGSFPWKHFLYGLEENRKMMCLTWLHKKGGSPCDLPPLLITPLFISTYHLL